LCVDRIGRASPRRPCLPPVDLALRRLLPRLLAGPKLKKAEQQDQSNCRDGDTRNGFR
jgi:hypothetical protein